MKTNFNTGENSSFPFLIVFILIFFGFFGQLSADEGFGIPTRNYGIGFGNLPKFSGLRFNLMDKNIDTINGINITFWKAEKDNVSGKVNGISAGIFPHADTLNGIQLGLAGVEARRNINGFTLGIIGAGCGEDMKGINIGGIGVGCGGNLIGINIGGIGAGCGKNMTGINIGGIGVGAGNNLAGINFGLLGTGAGNNVTGINIGGLGVGAGNTLTGLSISGLGVGAPTVKGLVIAGLGAGGNKLHGAFFSLGTIQVKNDGIMNGLAVSAFNFIKGTQKGVSIGIVNYAYRLRGLQIGLINIVRDNPAGRKVLPLINFNF